MPSNYEKLGVAPGTPLDQVEKAYKKLVKQYHPDLHPDDPDAASKMAEINAAYDDLKKGRTGEEQEFQGGPGGFPGGFQNPFDMMRAAMGGFAQQHHLAIPLETILRGGTVEFNDSSAMILNGRLVKRTISKKIPIRPNQPVDQIIQLVDQGETFHFIPRVIQSERYRIEGIDIEMTTKVGVFDALLGGKITIRTPEGRDQTFSLVPGSSSDKVFRFKNQGLSLSDGTRGSLIVKIIIDVPVISNKDLLEQLAQIRDSLG